MLIDGFGDIVIHAGFEAKIPIAFHGAGGHGDDGQIRQLQLSPDQASGFDAIHFRHLYVHQHRMIIAAFAQMLDSLGTIVHNIERDTDVAENFGNHLLVGLMVFNEQDSGADELLSAAGCQQMEAAAAVVFCLLQSENLLNRVDKGRSFHRSLDNTQPLWRICINQTVISSDNDERDSFLSLMSRGIQRLQQLAPAWSP